MDAEGNAVDTNNNSNVNSNVSADKMPANSKSKNNNSAAESDKVTRNIKGKKEIVFELAQLKSKGYPAPVNMSQK